MLFLKLPMAGDFVSVIGTSSLKRAFPGHLLLACFIKNLVTLVELTFQWGQTDSTQTNSVLECARERNKCSAEKRNEATESRAPGWFGPGSQKPLRG